MSNGSGRYFSDGEAERMINELQRERERFDAYLAGVAAGVELEGPISPAHFREYVRDGFAEHERDSYD